MANPPHSSADASAGKRRVFRTLAEPDADMLEETLHHTFGIARLRTGQREVIENIMQGRDTLAVMPTGAGKSLCYQLPALKLPGTTVVVSPLISLMKDQVSKLDEAGVAAAEVNSTLTSRQEAQTLEDIEQASHEFVFATPERLADPDFIAAVRQNKIDLFVIDEAHCISRWGHDFRPAYLQLGAAIEALGNPTVLALTATATDAVIADIRNQLKRPEMDVINTGIYRPNLHYRVISATGEAEKLDQTILLVRKFEGPGIVYAATVKAVEELHRILEENGESVTRYHGQLPARERIRNQDMFMAGQRRVMVATNAFGMGIDKQNIRFVIHHQIPAGLEAYYQESGRAGRDGADTDCILLYYAKDKRVQQFFLARRYPGKHEVEAVHAALRSLAARASPVSVERLQNELPLSNNRLQIALKLLKDGGFVKQNDTLDYLVTGKAARSADYRRMVETYDRKNEHDHAALERMVFYAQTGFCRWKVLLEYFGEKVDWQHCGSCDNCLHPPEQGLSALPVQQRQLAATMQKQAPGLTVGSTVQVAKFGQGQIVSIASDKVTIVFPDSATRTFLRSYVKPA